MTPRRVRRRLGLGLTAALALTAGCGVPQDEEPRALDRSAAPFRLFGTRPPPLPHGELQAELYFVQVDRLVSVPRPVPQPGSPAQVLEQLFDGPTEAERNAGLSTAIPSVVSVERVQVADRIAVVSLARLDESARADSVTAFAQIVATLDALENIDGVRFRTGDLDLAVPRGDGSLTDTPLDRSAYPLLLGEAPPTAAPAVEPAATALPGTAALPGVPPAPARVAITPGP